MNDDRVDEKSRTHFRLLTLGSWTGQVGKGRRSKWLGPETLNVRICGARMGMINNVYISSDWANERVDGAVGCFIQLCWHWQLQPSDSQDVCIQTQPIGAHSKGEKVQWRIVISAILDSRFASIRMSCGCRPWFVSIAVHPRPTTTTLCKLGTLYAVAGRSLCACPNPAALFCSRPATYTTCSVQESVTAREPRFTEMALREHSKCGHVNVQRGILTGFTLIVVYPKRRVYRSYVVVELGAMAKRVHTNFNWSASQFRSVRFKSTWSQISISNGHVCLLAIALAMTIN